MSSTAEVVPFSARRKIYLGMDVHKESITIAVLPADANVPTHLDRLRNDLPKLKRWIDRVARVGDSRALDFPSGRNVHSRCLCGLWYVSLLTERGIWTRPSTSPSRHGSLRTGRVTR